MVAIQAPQLDQDEWLDDDERPRLRLVERRRRRAPALRVPDRATRIRRRRLVALIAVAAVVALVWVGLRAVVPAVVGTSVGVDDPEPLPVTDGTYVVQPGDSLWSIARRMAPGDDPRPIVDELRERYGDASLETGDRLELDLG
jgi:LysM domain-containing protein